MKDSSRPTAIQEWLVAIAVVILIVSLAPPADAAAAERNSNSSRSGGTVSRSDVATRTSSGSSSTRSGAASSTRSGGRRGGGTATRSSRGGSSNRHRYSNNYRYNHRSYWGAFLGFYPWSQFWSYYGHYGYPYSYYPISPMLYYGPHPGDYRDQRLGALDLNVKPKKTDVWVDGQLVGTSGKFDGFPGYLWLERGSHQLVFYRPGMATEVREVRVLQGTVVKVNLRLVEGESVAPESLVKKEYGRRRKPARRAAAPVPEVIEAERAPEAAPRQMKKTTVEPGRLILSIEPADASVYLDGRFLGTAQELSKLHAGLLVSAGAHTLEVVRPGFGAERMELEVEADTETSLAIALESD